MATAISMATVAAAIGTLDSRFHLRRRRCDTETLRRRNTLARMRSSPAPRLPFSPRALHDPFAAHQENEQDEDEPFSVLASLSSNYNNIKVVDTPSSRFLLLDSTYNIHSMLNKVQKWTGSYWDDFATLPAIIPKGPIAILGLGAGTTAHLMLELWPSLQVEGWEIDEILIDMAREYFSLSSLEKCTEAGGSLTVHIGDALSASATVQGGFAGIIVDLFSDGKILPQLCEDTTWLELEKKLMPHGRIMVNCGGGAHFEVSDPSDRTVNTGVSWAANSTIESMCRTFPGKLSWKRISDKDSDNYLMLTGSLPDLNAWAAALPAPLSFSVQHWKPCEFCCD